MDSLRHLDNQILTDVNGFARHTGWLHGVVLGYANYGVVLIAALLLAGLWLRRAGSSRVLAAAGWAALATVFAVGLNQPLVNAVAEARPYATHPGLLVLASHSADYSFPSNHAVMVGAATAGLWLVSRTLGAIAAVAALAMAFARVYIGAHYPWDVVAGLLFGAVVAVVGWLLLRVPLTAITGWLRRRPGVHRLSPVPASTPALREPTRPQATAA